MQIPLRLDYATFNFEKMSPGFLGELLCGESDLAWRKSYRGSDKPLEESLCISPYGLTFKPDNGFSDRPYTVQVSGSGCEHFSETLPVLTSDAGNFHISRLDFAFDVPMSKDNWMTLVKSAVLESFDRDLKKVSFQGKGFDTTLYIGSRKCPYFFRIYNKSLESNQNWFWCDGEKLDVPEDFFLIRFEVELKRFRRTVRGDKVLITPQPLFDAYYGDDFVSVVDYLRELWESYCDSGFLPPFDDLNFVPYYTLTKTKNFVSSVSAANFSEVCETVVDHLPEAPFEFNKTLEYVISRFGCYFPFIAADPDSWQRCIVSSKFKYRFIPPVDVLLTTSEPGYDDFDFEDLQPDLPFDFSLPDQMSIESFKEGGNYCGY